MVTNCFTQTVASPVGCQTVTTNWNEMERVGAGSFEVDVVHIIG